MTEPDSGWRWDQTPNTASYSLRRIVFDGAPILYVSHDRDDHAWQFLDMGEASPEDACIVGLGQIVEEDPSLHELAEMPPGWHAWRRAPGEPWQSGPNPNDPETDE